MNNLRNIIYATWAIFWIYWFISAVGAKRNVRHSISGFRIILIIVVLVVLNLNGGHHGSWNSGAFIHTPIIRAIGVVMFVAGLLFAVWARVYLGKNWGMPMSQKKDPELVTSGPYHYVRHPIYTGILLGGLGTGLAVNIGWLIATVVIGSYFIYSARQEEAYLSKQFGESYVRYKKRSKMLLPFIF